ncbi:MFS transporter [Apiospora hydei]|uniref:MFS transporter n=1 Tax=Apiospora hydei TaxID=1337664 RepID=A0ABR1WYA9_9PEZI
MGANIARIYGAQIFRKDDRPLYRGGFSVAIAVLCVGFVIALGRWIDDKRKQRKNKNQLEGASSSSRDSNADAGAEKEVLPVELKSSAVDPLR